MRKVLEVDILNDADTRRRVGLWSLAPLGAGVLGAALLALAGADAAEAGPEAFGWRWQLALTLGFLASLPVHELVHAAFFRLFGGRGTRVRFGFQAGMLYASCPGRRFARREFLAVLLAPLTLLTCVYVLIGIFCGLPLLAWALAWLHASGCAGDAYFAWLIARHPEADTCEDTSVGITLWSGCGAE